jgi:micrococcal nuclease
MSTFAARTSTRTSEEPNSTARPSKGVRADSSTIWPDGFDLARAVSEAAAPPAQKVEVPPDAVEDVVSKVADGDTIELRALGPVRLLGIDAPAEERPADCFGHEATKAVRRLLPPGTRVRYALGNTLVDAFHRNLAYLWLRNGDFVEERIVSAGYANFLRPPRKKELPEVEQGYARRLKRDEIRAAMETRGLWNACSATAD